MDFLSNFLNDTLLVSLSKTLLHFVWQGAALALVLFLLLKLLDKQRSRARYLISLFIFGLNVVVPTLTFLHFNEVHTAVVAVEPVTGNVPVVAPSQASLIVESAVSFDWQLLLPIIAVSWLVGVCWLSAQLIYEVHKVNQLPRQGTSEVEQHIQELFERLTHQLKANPLTRLMVSTKAEVPMVIGRLKPVVLVPTSMIVGLTSVQLEMLLAHELAHVKRHDYLINFFQTLVEVLFFFHPCVKWISNRIRVEREYCCDDIAVGCCGNPTAYARALTNAELIRPRKYSTTCNGSYWRRFEKTCFTFGRSTA
ncbi:M56 family metallopeptidase [Alteromonadaceae bacterium M269]|nr:M56 family metallopeptidase [Alteromonadaceae bacterium M269]